MVIADKYTSILVGDDHWDALQIISLAHLIWRGGVALQRLQRTRWTLTMELYRTGN
jgi:hypothetical protein